MEKRVTYLIWPRNIRFEEKLMLLLGDFAASRGLELAEGPGYRSISHYQLFIDEFESVGCSTMEEFLALLKRTRSFDDLFCEFALEDAQRERQLRIELRLFKNRIQVELGSGDIDLVESAHAYIKDNFGFRNPETPAGDERRAKVLQPTVFVARHFDAAADEYFESLSCFLRLLGFEVKQGREYASEAVPVKVKTRIEEQDIFIALVSGKRERPWLVSEPSYALGKGKHIIVLVEEGTRYDPTIMGRDLEQIRFPPGHIESAFIPLLQEFHSVGVRRLRQTWI